MTAKPNQFYNFIINPYQKEIVLHMAFHMPCIIPRKHMRLELFGYFFTAFQISDNIVKLFQPCGIVFISLQVFAKLATALNFSHSLQDLIKFSKLLVSTSFRFFPERASFIAAWVSSLGSLYMMSIKRHST